MGNVFEGALVRTAEMPRLQHFAKKALGELCKAFIETQCPLIVRPPNWKWTQLGVNMTIDALASAMV